MSDGSMTVDLALVMTMLVRSIGLLTNIQLVTGVHLVISLTFCKTSSTAPDRRSKFPSLLYACLASVQRSTPWHSLPMECIREAEN
jgi:hypothetical protein